MRFGKEEGGVSWSEIDKPPMRKRLRKSNLFMRNRREGGEGGKWRENEQLWSRKMQEGRSRMSCLDDSFIYVLRVRP